MPRTPQPNNRHSGVSHVLLTPEVVSHALKASIASGKTAQQIADEIGIARRSLFNYQNDGLTVELTQAAHRMLQWVKQQEEKS